MYPAILFSANFSTCCKLSAFYLWLNRIGLALPTPPCYWDPPILYKCVLLCFINFVWFWFSICHHWIKVTYYARSLAIISTIQHLRWMSGLYQSPLFIAWSDEWTYAQKALQFLSTGEALSPTASHSEWTWKFLVCRGETCFHIVAPSVSKTNFVV
jgi:hypothetical protein